MLAILRFSGAFAWRWLKIIVIGFPKKEPIMSDATIDQAAQDAAAGALNPDGTPAAPAPAPEPVPPTPAEQSAQLHSLFGTAKTLAAEIEAKLKAELADVETELRAKVAELEAGGLTVEHDLDNLAAGAERFAVKVFQMVKTEI